MLRSRITLSDEQVNALEAHLAGTLKPVTPPMAVVDRLRARIHFPHPEDIVSRMRDWRRMFFIFSGVMSGLLAIITIGRALYYFVGRRQV
jgi:hypothetical protein